MKTKSTNSIEKLSDESMTGGDLAFFLHGINLVFNLVKRQRMMPDIYPIYQCYGVFKELMIAGYTLTGGFGEFFFFYIFAL